MTSLWTKWFCMSELRKGPVLISTLVHHINQEARTPLSLIELWFMLLFSSLTHQEHNEYIMLGATKSCQLIRHYKALSH